MKKNPYALNFDLNTQDQGDDESPNYTLKAISALAYLCDEAAEFNQIASSTLVPAILLFAPDPLSAYSDHASESTHHMLSEDALGQRENDKNRKNANEAEIIKHSFHDTKRDLRVEIEYDDDKALSKACIVQYILLRFSNIIIHL